MDEASVFLIILNKGIIERIADRSFDYFLINVFPGFTIIVCV